MASNRMYSLISILAWFPDARVRQSQANSTGTASLPYIFSNTLVVGLI